MRGRVLVIDDDRKLCGLLSDYLTEAGFEVHAVQRAEDGLRLLRSLHPGIVIRPSLVFSPMTSACPSTSTTINQPPGS